MSAGSKLTFNIKETAEILVPDKLGRVSYVVAIAMMGLMTGVITVMMGRLPAVVPLYFTLPWGEARLASRTMLYILPIVGLGVSVVNLSLGRMASKLSPILPRALAVGTWVINLMLLLSLLGILQSLIL